MSTLPHSRDGKAETETSAAGLAEEVPLRQLLPRRGFFAWLIDRLYGNDVFLSYTRLDDPDSRYALALYARLSNGSPRLRCFLDEKKLSNDGILTDELKRQIRSSRIIVILAGVGAGDRETVLAEAQYATDYKKRILVIDRGIGWATSTCPLKEIVGNRISIPEQSGRPTASRRVTTAIRRHVGIWRVNLVRRCAILLAFAIVLGFAAASYISYREEAKARAEATRQQGLAEQREKGERAARKDAEDLFDFLRRDVRSVLVSVGRMDIMEGVNRKMREYYTKNAATIGMVGMLNSQTHEELQRGEILLESGQLEEARRAFEAARRFGLQAVEASGNKVWKALIAQASTRVGDLDRKIPGADLVEAEARYTEAVKIGEELRRLLPADELWLRTWTAAQGGLADLKLEGGDPQGALGLLMEIDRVLVEHGAAAAGQPSDLLTRDHVLVLQQLSECHLRLKKPLDALTIAKRLMKMAEPFINSKDRRGLELAARSRSFLADVYRAAGDFTKARELYEQVAQTTSVLVATDERNVTWLELAASSSLSFGEECAIAGDTDRAVVAFRQGLDFAEQSWRANLTNWKPLETIVIAAEQLTKALRKRGGPADAAAAEESLKRGRQAVETLVRQAPLNDVKAVEVQRAFETFSKQLP